MSACRAVPQVRYLTQVFGQVVLVVSLSGQLQAATERVQPHWIGPAESNSIMHITDEIQRKYEWGATKITQNSFLTLTYLKFWGFFYGESVATSKLKQQNTSIIW